MSISPLFKRLNDLEMKMEESSEITCVDQLDQLDQSYDDAWNDIFNYAPQSSDLAELMLLLLLDKMADRSARGESVVQIREKIFDLFQTSHERVSGDGTRLSDYAESPGLV